jgi:hypothetical protein
VVSPTEGSVMDPAMVRPAVERPPSSSRRSVPLAVVSSSGSSLCLSDRDRLGSPPDCMCVPPEEIDHRQDKPPDRVDDGKDPRRPPKKRRRQRELPSWMYLRRSRWTPEAEDYLAEGIPGSLGRFWRCYDERAATVAQRKKDRSRRTRERNKRLAAFEAVSSSAKEERHGEDHHDPIQKQQGVEGHRREKSSRG